MNSNEKLLSHFIPELAVPLMLRWINFFKAELKITHGRQTKLGDYRSPYDGNTHRISINNNLNKFAFLTTLVHEFAHLSCWNKFQNSVKPHGEEWKEEFRKAMNPVFALDIFPPDVKIALENYLKNPKAASCSDASLLRTLRKYDQIKDEGVAVEQLPQAAIFALKNGRVFKKQEKIRKRYRCIELATKSIYLFNPLAIVYPQTG